MREQTICAIHTINGLNPEGGGPSRTVPELAIALRQLDAPISVWTPGTQPPEWTIAMRDAGIAIWSGDLATKLRSKSELSIIHDHGVWLPVNHSVSNVARRAGIARVVSPRGMLEPWALNHRRWKKRLAWILYQHRDLLQASALHATAESEVENLCRLGLRSPIFVIPNGIQSPPRAFTLPKKNSLGAQRVKTAVFLSRIHPKKGLPMLAEAWNRIRPTEWRMIVVGPNEGGHRNEIELLTRRLGIASEWEFHDHAFGDEKWRRLAEADLMILPTHSENFGNVVPEALIVETPVITTTGAPWEGLVTHRCGWWTEPTVEGIEAALRSAVSTPPSELHEMGKRGREWVLRDFAWPGIAKRMLAAYEAVLAGTRTDDFVD